MELMNTSPDSGLPIETLRCCLPKVLLAKKIHLYSLTHMADTLNAEPNAFSLISDSGIQLDYDQQFCIIL